MSLVSGEWEQLAELLVDCYGLDETSEMGIEWMWLDEDYVRVYISEDDVGRTMVYVETPEDTAGTGYYTMGDLASRMQEIFGF